MIPDLSELRSRADRLAGRRDAALARLEKTRQDIHRLSNEAEALALVSELFRQMIDKEVTLGVQAIERLLSEALRAVFDDQDLRVRADIEIQRGKVSVDLVTIQTRTDGTVIEGLSRDGFGGAVTTVQSILLRIIVLLKRGLQPVLLLDETLPALDGNYVSNMGRFLRVLCERVGIDILLVTFNSALVSSADKAYQITTTDGSARFKEIA